jgi:hypothetical protein
MGNTPGLGDAYEMANNILDAGVGLDYWQEQVTNPVNDASGSESDEASSDEEGCSDLELRQTLRLSREDFCSKQLRKRVARCTASLPTSSLSPLTLTRCSGNHQGAVAAQVNGASTSFTPTWIAPPSTVASLSDFPDHDGKPRAPSSSGDRLHVYRPDTPIDLTNEGTSSRSAGKLPTRPTSPKLASFIDNALGGLGRGLKEPTSDIVDGELWVR